MREVIFKRRKITRQQVIQALAQFDAEFPETNDYKNWLHNAIYDFAVLYNGKLYPPKQILRLASGESKFSGGDQTNNVFRDLGFTIIDKPADTAVDRKYTLTEEDRSIIAQTMQLTYREGGKVLVSSYQYERDERARRACINEYGYDCGVCGFNFEQAFGKIGEGFIHVHHLTPLSEQDGEQEIDPVKDLRPVCPNCHAMLHKGDPLYSIEELKYILQQVSK